VENYGKTFRLKIQVALMTEHGGGDCILSSSKYVLKSCSLRWVLSVTDGGFRRAFQAFVFLYVSFVSFRASSF
jgi:hypothetical protein